MQIMEPNGVLQVLGRTSVQAGLLVVLVLGVQWLLRKQLTPRWRCALWLLVVGRLLLPVSLGSGVSVFNVFPRLASASATVPQPKPIGGATPAEYRAVWEPHFVQRNLPTATPVKEAAGDLLVEPPVAAPASSRSRLANTPVSAVAPQPAPQPVRWQDVTFAIWALGVAVLGLHIVVSSWRLSRKFGQLAPVNEASLLNLLEDCQQRLGVRKRLLVVESSDVPTPVLHGLFVPKLVLPQGFATRFSPEELRFIFLHELAHVKRRDIAMNWLVALLQAMHWFNPLVWFGFARWRADRELACDALALDAAGADQNREYGRTILRLLENLTPRVTAPGLVGILEDHRQLKQRLRMIAGYRPARRWGIWSVLLLAGLAVVCLTDALEKEPARAKPDVLSETPAPSQRPVVTNGPSMKVTVLDAETGQPITGAEVLAPNQAAFWSGEENAPRWLTDEAGVAIIRLGEVPPETMQQNAWLTLSARRDGYAPRGASWAVGKGDARLSLPKEFLVRLERGTTIGGIVRDEAGVPQAGVHVQVFGTGYAWRGSRVPDQTYPEYWRGAKNSPGIVTDVQGRWQASDFPHDLESVTINLSRTEGDTQRFTHLNQEMNPLNHPAGEPLDLSDLRAGKAQFVLKAGFTVRGVVLDPQGHALPNVLVKAGHGAGNRVRDGEFRTDAAGMFELRHRPRRQMILTAYPPDSAITSTIVDVKEQMSEVRLQVAPLCPLHIRVVDGENRPIVGAVLGLDGYRTEGQVLDFSGTTDANGWYLWTNAPVAHLALTVRATNHASFPLFGIGQMVRRAPTNQLVISRLRAGMEHELIVHAKARDAASGMPVAVKTVSFQTGDREGLKIFAEPSAAEFDLKIPASRFRQGMWPTYQLRLDAEGCESLVTPWRDLVEGDWDVEFAMQRGRSGGTALLNNGKPAARAAIAIPSRDLPMYMYSPGQPPRDWATVVRADEDGHFEITHPGSDLPVLIMHEEGFLATTVDRLKGQPRLTLVPWGRVEGVLRAGTNAVPRANVHLAGGKLGAMNGWHFIFNADTDAKGRFVFEKVPPVDCGLYRYFNQGDGRSPAASCQQPVKVKAGEITRVEYGGTGRPIVGRVEGEAD